MLIAMHKAEWLDNIFKKGKIQPPQVPSFVIG